MDNLTKAQRRKNMQAIKSVDTKPEKILGKALFAEGLRYRKNDKLVYGRPDFVFKQFKLAVFVDGEFWHGRKWNIKKAKIKTNRTYWIPKIENNIKRDKKVNRLLRSEGWKVIRFWDTLVKQNTKKCVQKVLNFVNEIKQNRIP